MKEQDICKDCKYDKDCTYLKTMDLKGSYIAICSKFEGTWVEDKKETQKKEGENK